MHVNACGGFPVESFSESIAVV